MTNRLLISSVCAVLFLCIVSTAHAENIKCTQKQAMQAEKEASMLNNWNSVYKSFLRYRSCDDGAISEGYSYSVVKLLAHDWHQLPRLVALVDANTAFRDFVVHHVDFTAPAEEIKLINLNAHSKCGPDAKQFCQLLESRIALLYAEARKVKQN